MFKLEMHEKNRIYGLDILRSIAILIILLIHSIAILPASVSNYFFKYLAFDGVTLFFVLSGYLICTSLIILLENNPCDNREKISLFGIYLTRRWYRTLPNYFLILIIVSLLTWHFNSKADFSELYKYFIFSQNLFYPMPDFFPESWSLSVEEWFYLLIPAAILIVNILTKSIKKAIIIVSLLTIITALLYRFHLYLTIPEKTPTNWDLFFRKEVFTRLDSSIIGVLAAYFSYYHSGIFNKYYKIFLLIGISIICFNKFNTFSDHFKCIYYLLLDPVGYAFLFPFFVRIRSGQGVWFTFFTFTALISYSLYLVHFSLIINFIFYFLRFLNMGMVTKFGLFWFLSFLMSFLLYKYFEVPTTRLRRKLN